WRAAGASGQRSAGREGGVRFGRIDDPTHLRLYRRHELESLCRASGLEVRHTYLSGHLFTHLSERLELAVRRRVNIRRRSVAADEAFARALDAVALTDLRVLRPLPNASTMLLVLRKPGP